MNIERFLGHLEKEKDDLDTQMVRAMEENKHSKAIALGSACLLIGALINAALKTQIEEKEDELKSSS